MMKLQTTSQYEQKYREQWNETFANDSYDHPDQFQDSKFSYDAVWLAALALHKTNEELKALKQNVSLANFTLDNTDMLSVNISSKIYNNVLNTSFNGATVSLMLFSLDFVITCEHKIILILLNLGLCKSSF